MDPRHYDRVARLTKTQFFLERGEWRESIRSRLIHMTKNRAVLLTEINPSVVRALTDMNDSEAEKLKKVVLRITREEAEDLETPGRHLDLLKRRSDEPNSEWLVRSRPENWTWLEMVAAGAITTSHHLGYALGTIFEENKSISDLALLAI